MFLRSINPTQRRRGSTRGFTLIELLVVVLILSILMAVALPLYLNAVSDSQKKTCRANMQSIANAEQAFKVSSPTHVYTATITDLSPNLQATPLCPSGGHYTVKLDDKGGPGTFTVHCDVADHDNSGNGFTPGLDNQ